MGRCGSCRTQTQHFCFVHQEFVCDGCLTSKGNIHGRCVVSTYRKWVQDSSYEWPPQCPACHEELDADGDNIRRSCLHVEHVVCVAKSAPPNYACADCKAPLKRSFDGSQLGEAALERVRQMPVLQAALPEPPRPEKSEEPQTNVRVPTVEPLEPHFERKSATLRVTETEGGRNVSRLATEDDRDRVPPPTQSNAVPTSHPPAVQITPREPAVQKSSETRIDMGIPPLKSKTGSSGSYSKREKTASKGVSASWRKTLKAGSRRLFDIRKLLRENRSRVAVAVLFIVSVIMIVYLSSGEDDAAVSSRPVVEDVSLPHIRVNPAFVKGPRDHGLARIRGRRTII